MNDQEQLLNAYQNLPIFPDVAPGLTELRSLGHKLVAFSNGVADSVRNLMNNAGIV